MKADVAAAEPGAVGVDQAGDGLQRSALAGPVGAEQRDDGARLDVQRHAMQGQDAAVVDHFDILYRQHFGPGGGGGGRGGGGGGRR